MKRAKGEGEKELVGGQDRAFRSELAFGRWPGQPPTTPTHPSLSLEGSKLDQGHRSEMRLLSQGCRVVGPEGTEEREISKSRHG